MWMLWTSIGHASVGLAPVLIVLWPARAVASDGFDHPFSYRSLRFPFEVGSSTTMAPRVHERLGLTSNSRSATRNIRKRGGGRGGQGAKPFSMNHRPISALINSRHSWFQKDLLLDPADSARA